MNNQSGQNNFTSYKNQQFLDDKVTYYQANQENYDSQEESKNGLTESFNYLDQRFSHQVIKQPYCPDHMLYEVKQTLNQNLRPRQDSFDQCAKQSLILFGINENSAYQDQQQQVIHHEHEGYPQGQNQNIVSPPFTIHSDTELECIENYTGVAQQSQSSYSQHQQNDSSVYLQQLLDSIPQLKSEEVKEDEEDTVRQEVPFLIDQSSEKIIEDGEIIPKVDSKSNHLLDQYYALIDGTLEKSKSLKDSAFTMILRQFRRWLTFFLLKPLFQIPGNYKGDHINLIIRKIKEFLAGILKINKNEVDNIAVGQIAKLYYGERMTSQENEYEQLKTRIKVDQTNNIFMLYNDLFELRKQNADNLERFFNDTLTRELFLRYFQSEFFILPFLRLGININQSQHDESEEEKESNEESKTSSNMRISSCSLRISKRVEIVEIESRGNNYKAGLRKKKKAPVVQSNQNDIIVKENSWSITTVQRVYLDLKMYLGEEFVKNSWPTRLQFIDQMKPPRGPGRFEKRNSE